MRSTYAKRTHARQGFTLLEVLFAIAILAIGLLAVAALLPVAALQQKRAMDAQLGTSFGKNAVSLAKAGGRDPFAATVVPTASAYFASDSTASNTVKVKKAYQTADPTGTFDYSISYRMDNAGDPINVLVSVFRKMPDVDPANAPVGYVYNPQFVKSAGVLVTDELVNNRTKIYGTLGGPASPASTFADVYRRNQLILIQGPTNTYYVAKITTGADVAGSAAYITPAIGAFPVNTAVTVYCATDYGLSGTLVAPFDHTKPTEVRAVAIVQGVIQ